MEWPSASLSNSDQVRSKTTFPSTVGIGASVEWKIKSLFEWVLETSSLVQFYR